MEWVGKGKRQLVRWVVGHLVVMGTLPWGVAVTGLRLPCFPTKLKRSLFFYMIFYKNYITFVLTPKPMHESLTSHKMFKHFIRNLKLL
jgi:hypothetical protein